MRALAVATPLLDRLAGGELTGTVAGVTRGAAYLELAGAVVALTARELPWMPNGVVLPRRADAVAWPQPGEPALLATGRVEAGALRVTWLAPAPPAWDAALTPHPRAAGVRQAVAARGAAILAALGVDADGTGADLARAGLALGAEPAGRTGVELLARSLAHGDARLAAHAAELLIGRGPGLTPEGDDVLAGAAAAVAAYGLALGWTPARTCGWCDCLTTRDLRARTTALSATLLELAAEGRVVEPLHGLLDLGPAAGSTWPRALRRLVAVGASTGRAVAAGAGMAALLMASARDLRSPTSLTQTAGRALRRVPDLEGATA